MSSNNQIITKLKLTSKNHIYELKNYPQNLLANSKMLGEGGIKFLNKSPLKNNDILLSRTKLPAFGQKNNKDNNRSYLNTSSNTKDKFKRTSRINLSKTRIFSEESNENSTNQIKLDNRFMLTKKDNAPLLTEKSETRIFSNNELKMQLNSRNNAESDSKTKTNVLLANRINNDRKDLKEISSYTSKVTPNQTNLNVLYSKVNKNNIVIDASVQLDKTSNGTSNTNNNQISENKPIKSHIYINTEINDNFRKKISNNTSRRINDLNSALDSGIIDMTGRNVIGLSSKNKSTEPLTKLTKNDDKLKTHSKLLNLKNLSNLQNNFSPNNYIKIDPNKLKEENETNQSTTKVKATTSSFTSKSSKNGLGAKLINFGAIECPEELHFLNVFLSKNTNNIGHNF